MQQSIRTLFLLLLSLATMSLHPFINDDGINKEAVVPVYKCYFGCDESLGATGVYNKARLLLASKQKICVKDIKSNTAYPVYSFDFTYCERGVYEDSLGLPTLITDYNFVPISGDTIAQNWRKALDERLYKGDTLRIENVVIRKEGKLVKLNEKLRLAVE